MSNWITLKLRLDCKLTYKLIRLHFLINFHSFMTQFTIEFVYYYLIILYYRYTKEGSLKEKTECAPTNGYYFLPLYEKGDYVLKVHPPAGLSFEPSEVALYVDGVTDKCSTGQDINFAFNGFGINGRVITLGQKIGPSGISVQLVSEKGDTRNTETTVGGDFHFTAVIPGKYSVKASHPRSVFSFKI